MSLTTSGSLALVTQVPASAGFPGGNGKLAFTSTRDGNDEIYSTNADGTGVVQLTSNTTYDRHPKWSPNGTTIAFESQPSAGDWEIKVMNADGTGVTQITNNTYADFEPDWSPDSSKITWRSGESGAGQIGVMNADGTGEVTLTNALEYDLEPAWAPDGTKIAYTSVQGNDVVVRVMNSDGTGQVTVASGTGYDSDPDWQPTAGIPATFSLTVARRGKGAGTVSSSPAGIRCGTDCSEAYPGGTVVTLQAKPAAGSVFVGWGGACSGTGACSVTMNAPTTVRATFSPI